MKKFLLTLSVIAVSTFLASAQNFNINASISSLVNSTVTGTPTLAAFTTDADIANGLITDPVSFAVKSNRLWKLMTSITAITSTPITGGPTAITAPLQPIHVSWGVVNGAAGTVTAFTAFANTNATSAAPVQATTGSRGANTVTGNTFTLRYKVTPGYDVDPGTYGVTVTYTITAQ